MFRVWLSGLSQVVPWSPAGIRTAVGSPWGRLEQSQGIPVIHLGALRGAQNTFSGVPCIC